MSKRLNDLEQRIWYLEQKVRTLEAKQGTSENITDESRKTSEPEIYPKKYLNNEPPGITYQQEVHRHPQQGVPSQPQQAGYQTQQESYQSQQAGYQTQQESYQPQQAGYQTQQNGKIKRGKIDLEGRVGKQVMGAVASLLVFVGLCSLAVLIYPYLDKEMKFAIMYILSFGTLTASLFLHKKYKNYFSISLVGCGVGMIYISFLLSRLYFHYINDYVLYGLFFIWAMGTVYLSKQLKVILFHIIGYIGITISVLFGTTMVSTWQEIIFLNVFQLMCILAYLFIKTDKQKINQISLGVLVILLSIGQYTTMLDYFLWETKVRSLEAYLMPTLSVILLAIPMVVIFIRILYAMEKGSLKIIMLFIQYLGSGILLYKAGDFIGMGLKMEIPSCIGFASTFVLWAFLFILYERKENQIVCRSIFFSLLAFVYLNYVNEDHYYLNRVNDIIGLLPFASFALLYAWKRKEKVYAYVGIIMIYLNSLVTISYSSEGFLRGWLPEILTVGSLITLYYLMTKWDFIQKTGWKISAYLVLLLSIFAFTYSFDSNDSTAIAVLVIGIINISIIYSGFFCKWKNVKDLFVRSGEENRILLGIIQILSELIMIMILFTIYEVENILLHWALVLLAVLYCAVNINVYQKRQKAKEWVGYIYGLRITVTTLAMVFSFISWDEHQLTGSIIALCLALIFILVGFRIKQKTLRLYGLFLTMMCVLKLLLIDISYDNSITRVIGFIGAGMICFVISWLYNRANKILKDEEIKND